MKLLARSLAVLAILLVASLVAFFLLAPRIVASDAVRERISAAARDALGREVRYAGLDFAVLPPSLVVVEPVISGATAKDAPLLEARTISLRLALLPLLARAVVIDSFVVDGATVRLVRTEEGVQLPAAGGKAESDTEGAEATAAVDLAVRQVELRDATVIFEDRVVVPSVTWKLSGLTARANGDSLDDPVDFSTSFAIDSGGELEASGRIAIGGDLEIAVQLEDIAVAQTQPYLGPDMLLAGLLSGTIEASGPATGPEVFGIDVELRESDLRTHDLALRGRLAIKANLAGDLDSLVGPYEVDATEAEFTLGGAFNKPLGMPATLAGELLRGEDGAPTLEHKLRVHTFESEGRVELGKPMRIVATAAPFELDGWDELIPALADYELSGRMQLDALTITPEPLDLRGVIGLDELGVKLGEGVRVTLDGGLRGEGNAVTTVELTLMAAGQAIGIQGAARDLAGTPRYTVHLDGSDIDTNRLVTTFAKRPNFMSGKLALTGDLSGSIEAEKTPLETLQGNLRLDVGPGQLRGVSLLRLAIDRLGVLGTAARITGSVLGGANLEPFYDDRFESIGTTLVARRGVVRTDDFRLTHAAYAAELEGQLGLRDLSMDMTGKIVLGEELLALLPNSWETRLDGTIPLARVTGSLDDPKVQLPNSFASQLLRASEVTKPIEKALDDALGTGAGDAVGDLLEGILGGGGQPRRGTQ